MDLETFRAEIKRLVRDDAAVLVDPGDYDFATREGVKRYARAKPREVVADVPGDGGYDYDLPAEYAPGFSRILEVEFPAGEREPQIVDRLDWTLYRSPSGDKLRFRHVEPAADETIRLTLTALHTVDVGGTTVPGADHDVIHLLGAALCCEQLASHYSRAMDSTIVADSVDHASKASEFALRAKRFRALADELLPQLAGGSVEESDVRPAGGETSWGNDMDLLTHPER